MNNAIYFEFMSFLVENAFKNVKELLFIKYAELIERTS